MTYLLEIRGADGHLGVFATHLPEFAATLRALVEQAGYTTKTKAITHPKEAQ